MSRHLTSMTAGYSDARAAIHQAGYLEGVGGDVYVQRCCLCGDELLRIDGKEIDGKGRDASTWAIGAYVTVALGTAGVRLVDEGGRPTCMQLVRDESAAVDRPAHYQVTPRTVTEVDDVIEMWDLNFRLGCVVKYVLRAGKKYDLIEDLKKARNYLDREIKRREREAS